VFFLISTSLYGIGVEAKPCVGIFDTTPFQMLAGKLDLLLATGKDVAINDLVQFAIR
jgi:hypothetical protein